MSFGSAVHGLHTRYLNTAGSDVLGILGGSVGLLIWLYIMTSGILIGAQVNVAVQEGPPETSRTGTEDSPSSRSE